MIFQYDAEGNRTYVIDRNAREYEFEYDELNRRTAVQITEVGEPTYEARFIYDGVGNLISAVDTFSAYTFTYDALNRLASVDNSGTPNAPSVALSYRYDAVGNIISVEDSLGVRVTSDYDARDLLVLSRWEGELDFAQIEFDYNDRDERVLIERFSDSEGNPISRTHLEYTPNGLTSRERHFDAMDQVFAEYSYNYDLDDQLIEFLANDQVSNYQYDAIGQIASVQGEDVLEDSFSWDLNGNPNDSQIVLGLDNRLVSDGQFTYKYDREGNLVQKTDVFNGEYTIYAYNHRNQITEIESFSSGGIILSQETFIYDVFGRRIALTMDSDGAGAEPEVTTHFIYDRDNVWGDFDQNHEVMVRYLFGDQVDDLLARWRASNHPNATANQGLAWYISDRLHSVRGILDSSGSLINTVDYNPFGVVIFETDPSSGDRFKFQGREFDTASGLYYFRARYYDPMLGRFLSKDPLGFDSGSFNLYQFAENNPLSNRDPFGLAALPERGIVQQQPPPVGRCTLWVEAGLSATRYFRQRIWTQRLPLPSCEAVLFFLTAGLRLSTFPNQPLLPARLDGLRVGVPGQIPSGQPFQFTGTWNGYPLLPFRN